VETKCYEEMNKKALVADATLDQIKKYIEEHTEEKHIAYDHAEHGDIGQHSLKSIYKMVKYAMTHPKLEFCFYKVYHGPNDDWETVTIHCGSDQLFVQYHNYDLPADFWNTVESMSDPE